jgi:hypothetical protein
MHSRRHCEKASLNPISVQAYAWLLLQLICLSNKNSSRYLAVAKIPDVLNLILKSSDGETRNLGQKVKHAVSLDCPTYISIRRLSLVVNTTTTTRIIGRSRSCLLLTSFSCRNGLSYARHILSMIRKSLPHAWLFT